MIQLWHLLSFVFIVILLLIIFSSNGMLVAAAALVGLFTFLAWILNYLHKKQERTIADLCCYKCKRDDVPIRIENAKGYVGRYWVCETCPIQSVDESGGI